MTTHNDPFASAAEAGDSKETGVYFGKVSVSATYCQLVKGTGRIPWTESDDPASRRTEVRITVNPIDAMNQTRMVERTMIAENKDWREVTWPSIRDLGLKSPRDLEGKYARLELVKTGRTYTNKQGQMREETCVKFTHLFENDAAATAAYWNKPVAQAAPQTGTPVAPTAAPVNDPERLTALQFLPALVKNAGGDRTALAGMIAQMPLISKFFTVDSPEVAALFGKVA